MNNLTEVYEKLNKRISADHLYMYPDTGDLVYKDSTIEAVFSDSQNKTNMHFFWEGKRYDYELRNVNEVYSIIKDLHRKRIRFCHREEKEVSVKGLLRYRLKVQRGWVKVILSLLGIAIIIAAGFMILAGVMTMIDRHFDMEWDDIGAFIVLGFAVNCGISLITYAFGRVIYEGIYFAGNVFMGFGLGLVCFQIYDYYSKEDSLQDTVFFILFFLFLAFVGGLFISVSHMKKTKTDVIIKRTPVLPSKTELDRILGNLYMDSTTLGFRIEPTEDMVLYTGSRVGGMPYSDGMRAAPVTISGKEMVFLFQINLSEISVPSPLPQSGILEFFIEDTWNERYLNVKVEYYPFISSLNLGYNFDAGSTAIRFIPEEMKSLWNIRLEDIYQSAFRMGIELQPDLELAEILKEADNEMYRESYLLGSTKPFAVESGNGVTLSGSEIPLVSFTYDSKLSVLLEQYLSELYMMDMQLFIRREDLAMRDFTNIITIADMEYER